MNLRPAPTRLYGFRVACLGILVALAASVNAQEVQETLPAEAPLSRPTATSLSHASGYYVPFKPLTISQQRARYEAEQRMYRTEWYQWIGYNPARPAVNASYMSFGEQYYYTPSRAAMFNTGPTRAWLW
ncbi:MAG: hypothetical protein KF752_06830 [Pirellulaceae bacterium]|nr:hypothetical protein [Pirellulaceae bacterium]